MGDDFGLGWMFRMTGKMAGAGMRGGLAAGQHTSSFLAEAAVMRRLKRSQRVMESGFAAPGDAAPASTVVGVDGFADYRGLATTDDVAGLLDGDYPVGRLWVPKARAGEDLPLYLPEALMARHAAVFGPSGSGKTYGLVAPWIGAAAHAGNTVIVVDVKGDLRQEFQKYCSRTGLRTRVASWNYTDPGRSLRWNWRREVEGGAGGGLDPAAVHAVATALIGRQPANNAGHVLHFWRRDARLLAGVLELYRWHRPADTVAGMTALLRDQSAVVDLVADHYGRPGVAELANVSGYGPGDYYSAISGVEAALSRVEEPRLEAVTADAPAPAGVRITDFLSSPCVVFVTVPEAGGDTSWAAASLMLNLLVLRLQHRFTTGARSRVSIVVDEAHRLTERFDFANALSMLRGAGASFVLASQDVSQFRDEEERDAILTNVAVAAALPGVNGKTAAWIEGRAGSTHRPFVAVNHAAAVHGLSLSESLVEVPVLSQSLIRNPHAGARPATLHLSAPELGITRKPLAVDLEY